MIILGVNSAYHEPAACLLVDGRIVAIAEEERFNRLRHGKHSRIDNAEDLPEAAIRYCLDTAGIGWQAIDAIGYSLDPDARCRANTGLPDASRVQEGDWGTPAGEQAFLASNLRARDALLERATNAELHFLPHHLCHAASAFLVSDFDDAAILVVDGIGDTGTTWLGVGSGTQMRELDTASYPNSIGFVWEKMSELLGFDAYSGPGKMMGYGCTTDPRGELSDRDHMSAMAEIFRAEPDGAFFVDNDVFRFRTGDFSELERRFGARRERVVDRYEDASIAAALQEATNDVLVHLGRRLYQLVNRDRDVPITNLCLAGGVALNCVSNHALAAHTPFERIWIQPAANDAGTAIGAAALLQAGSAAGGRVRMEHAYWGPGHAADAIDAALRDAGLSPQTPDSLARRVAERVERAEIVAWFQGRQEVGPRALGNRSILCDPSRFDMRNRINAQVKHRESFRPFAPSMLTPGMERFFDLPAEPLASRYMLVALPLRERRMAQMIPAVVQENGSTGQATSRVQWIDEQSNPLYAEVVAELDAMIGLPLILNTSFNVREPIVTTPREAITTFLRSSMDALAIGPYLVSHPGRS
jgi:carbamoyltransferase